MGTGSTSSKFQWLILAAFSLLIFFIFRPFLYSLILAAIVAIASWPLYEKIVRLLPRYPAAASFLTTFLIFVFILPLMFFLGMQIFREAQTLYLSLTQQDGKETFLKLLGTAAQRIKELFPQTKAISFDLDQYLMQAINWIIHNTGVVFTNFAAWLAESFVFVIALYYFLKDWKRLKKILMTVSPFTRDETEIILKKLSLAVNSVVKGNLALALIQGIVAALGFTIFGLPNPLLWGTITAVSALVPAVGTSLVLIPAIFYLYLNGKTINSLGLMIWALLAVGLIDNFLGPKLVGRGMRLHPLLVILAVWGGISFFGPIGFLLGPLCLALLLALFDIQFQFK